MATDTSQLPALNETPTESPPGGLLAQRTYRELRERIVTLHLPPGAALREDELISELGSGRTPLREALKRLALEGLVVVRSRRGTFVTDVAVADIVYITEVRAELEGQAAELAAMRMDERSRETAVHLIQEIKQLGPMESRVGPMKLDRRIHRCVWESSCNPYLIATLDTYFTLSMRGWHLVVDKAPGLGATVQDHAPILEALLARDGGTARKLMRDHVLAFQREIIAAFSRG